MEAFVTILPHRRDVQGVRGEPAINVARPGVELNRVGAAKVRCFEPLE